jgi:hypothetical protein
MHPLSSLVKGVPPNNEIQLTKRGNLQEGVQGLLSSLKRALQLISALVGSRVQ